MKSFARAAILALVTLPAAGCLFGGHSELKQEGNYVSPTTLGQIKPGETRSPWVKAVLGEPSERITVDDHMSIWRYAYTETKSGSGYVFLLFGGSDTKVTKSSVFVEFKDDVVTRHWRG